MENVAALWERNDEGVIGDITNTNSIVTFATAMSCGFGKGVAACSSSKAL